MKPEFILKRSSGLQDEGGVGVLPLRAALGAVDGVVHLLQAVQKVRQHCQREIETSSRQRSLFSVTLNGNGQPDKSAHRSFEVLFYEMFIVHTITLSHMAES